VTADRSRTMTADCFSLGAEVAGWATKAEVSTTARLPAGTEEDLLGLVGMVLPEWVRDMVLPAVVALVVTVVIEAISNERAQEVSTTGTRSGRDTKCTAMAPNQGICMWVV
jgi:hypothetical protein